MNVEMVRGVKSRDFKWGFDCTGYEIKELTVN
jgi:hypothetical protein